MSMTAYSTPETIQSTMRNDSKFAEMYMRQQMLPPPQRRRRSGINTQRRTRMRNESRKLDPIRSNILQRVQSNVNYTHARPLKIQKTNVSELSFLLYPFFSILIISFRLMRVKPMISCTWVDLLVSSWFKTWPLTPLMV